MFPSWKQNNPNPTRTSRAKIPEPVIGILTLVLRSLILGIGLATVIGTTLAKLDPQEYVQERVSSPQTATPTIEPLNNLDTDQYIEELHEPLLNLERQLTQLAKDYPELQPSAFFVDLDNRAYVRLGKANQPISAASTIKIPILVALFQDVDAGKIYLDEMLTMTEKHRAGGSGKMQYLAAGQKFTTLAVATQMIIVSDNTATNMLIERLGGAEVLNQRFKSWGLKSTAIRNYLPDLEGTNTTSPTDLVFLLDLINRGELVSTYSRDRLLRIMTDTQNNSLIPQGLESEAAIAHKTGDIGSVLADSGIVDMPSGKRYIGAIMVERPHNHPQARTLIQKISETTYQYFKSYDPRPVSD